MPVPILPPSPSPLSLKLKLKTRSLMSQAESGKILGRSKGSSYYEATLKYPPMKRDQFGEIAGFLTQNARPSTFYITIDPLTGTAGEIVGNHINFDNDTKLHLVTASYPAWALSTVYILNDLEVSVSNVYRCAIASMDTTSAPYNVAPTHTSGTVNDWEYQGPYVTIQPPMRNAGGNVVSNPVYMKCSLKGDVQTITLGKDGLVRFEIDVVERI